MKTDNDFFTDWENDTFGYGYGTGEVFTIKALKEFFDLLEDNHSYNYEILEKHFGGLSTWLLINILCHADILEYGTSPRFGWITKKGEWLRDFMKDKSVDDLYELTSKDESYYHCYPGTCNCDKPCNNPMFSL